MKKSNPRLKNMLIEDLPSEFVTELIWEMKTIYPASLAAMIQDRSLGDEQKKAVLGHYRRGLAETQFDRIAIKHGLSNELVQPAGGGCKHVSVQVGRFRLDMCHVPSQDAFPQHSDDRKQSSKVNKFIPQLSLFEEQVAPDSRKIFGVIIHSEVPGEKDKLGSIKIGIPNHDWDGWIEEPFSLFEISEIQNKHYRKEEDLQSKIQNEKAKPRLKTISKKEAV